MINSQTPISGHQIEVKIHKTIGITWRHLIGQESLTLDLYYSCSKRIANFSLLDKIPNNHLNKIEKFSYSLTKSFQIEHTKQKPCCLESLLWHGCLCSLWSFPTCSTLARANSSLVGQLRRDTLWERRFERCKQSLNFDTGPVHILSSISLLSYWFSFWADGCLLFWS